MEIFDVIWNRYDKPNELMYIGVLSNDNDGWYFIYDQENTVKAISNGFCPFAEMPIYTEVYHSKELFKSFNRRYFIDNNISVMEQIKNQDGKLVTDYVSIKYRRKVANE